MTSQTISNSITVGFFAVSWSSALAVWDVKHRRLPNALTLGGAAAALVWRLGYGGPGLFVDGFLAGVIAGAFMLVPFAVKGAGGGDVKMLFAGGAIVGLHSILLFLWFSSLAGLLVGIVMIVCGRLDASRTKHYGRCVIDWRYDRERGRAALPPKESERTRIPFGLAIAIGLLVTLALDHGMKAL